MLDLKQVDNRWTLFLDRDGVLNEDKVGSYIFHPGEFHFYTGTLEAMKIFAGLFGRIVIVTNQRGISKGLMTETDLHAIHRHMQQEIEAAGGRIDAIYYATSLDNAHPDRKPQPGMAVKAALAFPEIDFGKSIMVGNNLSDMEFARNAAMYAVFVQTTVTDLAFPHPHIDLAFNTLLNFAHALAAGKI
jgi:histidinol-phosphate phosphatase family protein